MRSLAEWKAALPGIAAVAVMGAGESAFVVMVASFARAFVGAGHIRFDTLVRDSNRVGALTDGSTGEGAIQTLHIDALTAPGADLSLHRRVHSGEKFSAELVQNLVDVNIRQSSLACISFERYRLEVPMSQSRDMG
jgi:hypothetical protein